MYEQICRVFRVRNCYVTISHGNGLKKSLKKDYRFGRGLTAKGRGVLSFRV